jgi:hypothetical protein
MSAGQNWLAPADSIAGDKIDWTKVRYGRDPFEEVERERASEVLCDMGDKMLPQVHLDLRNARQPYAQHRRMSNERNRRYRARLKMQPWTRP